MKETLTKENFFNQLQEECPDTMKLFCEWVDKYKEENNFRELFGHRVPGVKYHELPYAFQLGMFMQFADEIQPEKRGIELREIMSDFFHTREPGYHPFTDVK